MRLYQFGHDTAFYRHAFYDIARQRRLYSLLGESGSFDVEAAFLNAAKGVSLNEIFRLLGILLATVQKTLSGDEILLPASLMHKPTHRGEEIIASLAEKWIRTPDQYRAGFKELSVERDMNETDNALDLQCLRESPLIAVGDDTVASPCLLFLRDLITDAAYYLIVDSLQDKNKRQGFQAPLGESFALYVEGLLNRVAAGDGRGTWKAYHRVKIKKSGSDSELADSILWRDGTAIVVEHKAQRPGREFLSGHSGQRVLGPSDTVLTRVEASQGYSWAEGKSTAGWLIQGMWQHSENGPELAAWIRKQTGEELVKAFPLLVNLYEPEVDSVARGVYIEPLIQAVGLYSDSFWRRPQWLHISDLEKLASLADSVKLDIEKLLDTKNQDVKLRFERFRDFLSGQFDSIPVDRELAEFGMEFLKGAHDFFPEGE